jgi:hypothetical protein
LISTNRFWSCLQSHAADAWIMRKKKTPKELKENREREVGSGSGTDGIAAAQVGRSCISMERDPVQYVQSVARAQAALAAHEEKISKMTDLEIALVSGRIYFDPPPPHAGASFLWTVPVGQPQNNESTNS